MSDKLYSGDPVSGVMSAANSAPSSSGGARRAEIEQRLGVLFRKTGADPLMARLRHAILQYRLGMLP